MGGPGGPMGGPGGPCGGPPTSIQAQLEWQKMQQLSKKNYFECCNLDRREKKSVAN